MNASSLTESVMLGAALSGTAFETILYGVGALILLVLAIIVLNFGMIWVRAWTSGAKVTFTELIALRLRNVPVGVVVDTRITAIKSGLAVTIDDLSTHFLAGGTIEMVVQALIAAQKAGIRLDFDRACAIDLATKGTGKTVLEAVKTSVNPKVIDCPNPTSGKSTVDAVALPMEVQEILAAAILVIPALLETLIQEEQAALQTHLVHQTL